MNRKNESKYDLVRKSSATNPKLVGAGVNTMGYSLTRNTNNRYNFHKEKTIFDLILSKRGYGKSSLSKILKRIEHKTPKSKDIVVQRKKFCGKITFDKLTKQHGILKNMIISSGLPNSLERPILVGNKKTKQYVFTKMCFYKKLKTLAEKNTEN